MPKAATSLVFLAFSLNHNITEWFGLEKTFKIISFGLDAVGRNTFH